MRCTRCILYNHSSTTHILVNRVEFSLAHLRNVGTGSEGLLTSGQDEATDIFLIAERISSMDQIFEQIIAKCIQRFGPVQSYQSDTTFVGSLVVEAPLHLDVFVRIFQRREAPQGVGSTCFGTTSGERCEVVCLADHDVQVNELLSPSSSAWQMANTCNSDTTRTHTHTHTYMHTEY